MRRLVSMFTPHAHHKASVHNAFSNQDSGTLTKLTFPSTNNDPLSRASKATPDDIALLPLSWKLHLRPSLIVNEPNLSHLTQINQHFAALAVPVQTGHVLVAHVDDVEFGAGGVVPDVDCAVGAEGGYAEELGFGGGRRSAG